MSLGLNSELYLASSGLAAATQQTNTAGRNLANSSTAGATKQTVVTKAGATVVIGGIPVSSGVDVVTVTSARSAYLDAQVQTENSNLGYAGSLDAFLEQTENALQESLSTTGANASTPNATGLEAATTALYTAWSSLAASPNSAAAQDAVSSAAQSFISTAQSVYNGILAVKSSGYTEANTQTDQVNSLSSQIAELNKEILSAETRGISADGTVNQANDLRDQRSALVEQLSTLVNVNVQQDPNNASLINVSLADSSTATDSSASTATFTGKALSSDLSGYTAGTLLVNGSAVTLAATDTISDVADKINAAVGGVTATVVNGKLTLTSASPVTVADGTGNFAAKAGLGNSGAASAAGSVYLVNGTASGGTKGKDYQTYSLTVGGSNAATNDTGYAADQTLHLLATTSTGAAVIADPSGGSLGGLVYMDQTALGAESQNPAAFTSGTTLLDKFNTFINNVVTGVNTATTAGVGVDGTAGENFFVANTGTNTASTGAFDLHLNNLYNTESSSYDGAGIPSGSAAATPLDGANAQAIANAVTGSSILPYYQGVVSGVGSQRSAAATNLSSQQLISTQAANQQQAYEGISTDSEMTDLLTFQRAFEASSRFINVIDQMYQTITQNLGS